MCHTAWLVQEERYEGLVPSTGRHPLPALGVDPWPRERSSVESIPSRRDVFETSRRRRSQEPEQHSPPDLVQSSRSRAQRGVGGKASLQNASDSLSLLA